MFDDHYIANDPIIDKPIVYKVIVMIDQENSYMTSF